jgi:hypothetical protein
MAVSSRKPRRRVSRKVSAQRKSARKSRKVSARKSRKVSRKSPKGKSRKVRSCKSARSSRKSARSSRKSARSSRKSARSSRKSPKSPSRRLAVDEFYCVGCRKKVKGENIKLVYLDNAKRGKVPALKASCELNGRRCKLIKFVALADVPKLKQMF